MAGGALEARKAAVPLAVPCMQHQAVRDAEHIDAAAAAGDVRRTAAAAAVCETAAVAAVPDGASAEWLQLNPSLRCCLECPLGHFHLWV